MSDIPKTWDAFIDFFIPVQKKLQTRACGTPMPPASWSARSATTRTQHFAQFLIAYGGQDIVTPDGKFHGNDPQVQEAVIKALDKTEQAVQGGLHPAELDQLERRRRQQRVPLQAVRDGFRRHAVDRAGDAAGSRRTSTTT